LQTTQTRDAKAAALLIAFMSSLFLFNVMESLFSIFVTIMMEEALNSTKALKNFQTAITVLEFVCNKLIDINIFDM